MGSAVLGSALPHIRSGRVRALGVSGAQRSPQLPDVPTIAEQGLAGYAFEPFYAIVVPARTPRELMGALADAIAKSMSTPEFREHSLKSSVRRRGQHAGADAAGREKRSRAHRQDRAHGQRQGGIRVARIAVGGFHHETNCFVPVHTDFNYFAPGERPSAAVARRRSAAQPAEQSIRHVGLLADMAAKHELVPLVWASGGAGGYVTSDAFERIVGELVGRLSWRCRSTPSISICTARCARSISRTAKARYCAASRNRRAEGAGSDQPRLSHQPHAGDGGAHRRNGDLLHLSACRPGRKPAAAPRRILTTILSAASPPAARSASFPS